MPINTRIHDPISLFISSINHGIKANKKYVFIPYDAIILELIKIVMKRGYITSYSIYKMINKNKHYTCIRVWLARYQNKYVASSIKTYYKPSQKLSKTHTQLRKIKHADNCEMLLSTSNGLRWLDECLRFKIGGILLFEVL